MDIPYIAWEEHGGNLELFRDVYRYSSAFMTDDEIAKATKMSPVTIRQYRANLKKTISSLPPDEMTQEALYGYMNMSDMMLQDMMQVYLEMREDREIFRNNVQPKDGKRRLPVHPKDMIALMQTLMKTQLERAAVLTKFAAVSEKGKPVLQTDNSINPNILVSENSPEIVDVEFTDLTKEKN